MDLIKVIVSVNAVLFILSLLINPASLGYDESAYACLSDRVFDHGATEWPMIPTAAGGPSLASYLHGDFTFSST